MKYVANPVEVKGKTVIILSPFVPFSFCAIGSNGELVLALQFFLPGNYKWHFFPLFSPFVFNVKCCIMGNANDIHMEVHMV